MIPIDIESLIDGHVIESNRLEFNEGWNPEKVIHSICAFANDIEDVGGGYIIIGVREQNGRAGEVLGIKKGDVPHIENEVMRLCNMMEPRYVPQFDEFEYKGKTIIVLWVMSDISRPFKCPVSISSDKSRPNEKAYYIRKNSHTVRANHDEEVRLSWLSSKVTFDDLVNMNADLDDVRMALMEDFLERVGSCLRRADLTKVELMESLRLARGPPESRKPLNIALMMFSDDPERFFPYARIEVVVKSDRAGNEMDEKVFTGPLDRQLTGALAQIRSSIITERVRKIDGRAEALRVFNYPYEAVEEVLVNAVYHRDYSIREPTVVTILPDSLEVMSFPGPDVSISDEEVSSLRMRSTYCRNKRLGDFLKELHLTEGRNTGMSKIKESAEANGSELPVFETDQNRSYLRVTFPIHKEFAKDGVRINELQTVPRRSYEQIREGILDCLRTGGCMSTREIYTAMGYSMVTTGFRNCLNDLIEEGTVEYLYPDKPRSSRQKVCLSRKAIGSRRSRYP